MSTKVFRQPVASTSRASGEDATRAPMLPTAWVKPETMPNSPGRNHSAASASQAISTTEAPRPTSRRPARATAKVGATPNRAAPSAIVTPPMVMVHRGPSVSARLPATSAIAAKT
jgi:hypothetical protein